ncbi:MAG: hypothetical protein OJF49_002417 [Ktedonobacterales bacterium]|jgi:hypothetical protein|nr:MAG: hypothetical protein OJF49_002417 [Ktedonobacterales bacterium]
MNTASPTTKTQTRAGQIAAPIAAALLILLFVGVFMLFGHRAPTARPAAVPHISQVHDFPEDGSGFIPARGQLLWHETMKSAAYIQPDAPYDNVNAAYVRPDAPYSDLTRDMDAASTARPDAAYSNLTRNLPRASSYIQPDAPYDNVAHDLSGAATCVRLSAPSMCVR